MVSSHVLRGNKVSDLPHAKLTVEALSAPEEGGVEIELDILHRPEALGKENVAYLVYGTPGTASYAFMDLNNLPPGVKVCVTVEQNGTTVSRTEFAESGATPQPLS